MSERVVKRVALSAICLILAAVILINGQSTVFSASATGQFETRCGWFSNPTPGNIWLYDRDGEWIIGIQGGYQVEGDWDWPDFPPGQWKATNGNYGYGCACLQVRVDYQTHKVLEIKSARSKPLAACKQDPSLKRGKATSK